MGFLAVVFSLIAGLVIGAILGIALETWVFYVSDDEEFEKKINDLRTGRDRYIKSHKD